MVPQLIARVDGLPVSLLDREVVWPPTAPTPRPPPDHANRAHRPPRPGRRPPPRYREVVWPHPARRHGRVAS